LRKKKSGNSEIAGGQLQNLPFGVFGEQKDLSKAPAIQNVELQPVLDDSAIPMHQKDNQEKSEKVSVNSSKELNPVPSTLEKVKASSLKENWYFLGSAESILANE
jgi:hypothetical protein